MIPWFHERSTWRFLLYAYGTFLDGFVLRSEVLHVGEHVMWKDNHRRKMDLWHRQSCRDENSNLAESAPMRQNPWAKVGVGSFGVS
jgi:hypothetical protein